MIRDLGYYSVVYGFLMQIEKLLSVKVLRFSCFATELFCYLVPAQYLMHVSQICYWVILFI